MLSGIKINLDFIPGTYYNRILQEAFTLYSIYGINEREYREQKIHKKKDYYNKKWGFSHWGFYFPSQLKIKEKWYKPLLKVEC